MHEIFVWSGRRGIGRHQVVQGLVNIDRSMSFESQILASADLHLDLSDDDENHRHEMRQHDPFHDVWIDCAR
jgi:hypothetical protein